MKHSQTIAGHAKVGFDASLANGIHCHIFATDSPVYDSSVGIVLANGSAKVLHSDGKKCETSNKMTIEHPSVNVSLTSIEYTKLCSAEYFTPVIKTLAVLFVVQRTLPFWASMQCNELLAEATKRRDWPSSVSIVLTIAVVRMNGESL